MAACATIGEERYESYRDALLVGDLGRCAELVEQLLADGCSPRVLHVDCFQRSLYDVGFLWERHSVSVAVEHLASATTERLLNQVLLKACPMPRVNTSVVIASVSPELHQIGAKIVADTFEMAGWDTYFVGANTPVKDLVELVSERAPDYVGLSLTLFSNLGELLDLLDSISRLGCEPRVVLGGQGLRRIGLRLTKARPNLIFCPSLEDLDRALLDSTEE